MSRLPDQNKINKKKEKKKKKKPYFSGVMSVELDVLNLSARYLETYLRKGLEI